MKAAIPKNVKYIRILDALRDAILNNQWNPGEQIPSVRELAEHHGASPLTARRAVEALIERGMLEGRQGVGTFVATVPTFHRIGIVLGAGRDDREILAEERYLRLAEKGFRSWAEAQNLSVSTYLYRDDDALWMESNSFRRDIESRTLDGVILVGVPSQTLALELLRRHVPIVAVGNVPPAAPYRVVLDYRNHMRAVVDHALRRGYRRVGFVAGVAPAGDTTSGHTLYRDYFLTHCADSEAETHPEWIRGVAPLTPETGRREALDLLSLGSRPDVLIVADDMLARGVLQAIRDRAVAVPRDLALIVHTNTGAAHFDFPVSLTRLEVDPSAVTGQAAGMLVELMSGNPPAEAVRRVFFEIVCGESC